LLAVNLLVAITPIVYTPVSKAPESILRSVNPEKIVLLPAAVDCIEWGYFSASSAASAKTALDKLNLHVPSKQIMSDTLTQFQIHTTPFNNQRSVEREINKLRNMGIVSYRILEQGTLFNAISFGEFAEQASAYDLQKKLNDKGINDTAISKHIIEHHKFLLFNMDAHKIAELETLIEQFPESKLTHATCERL